MLKHDGSVRRTYRTEDKTGGLNTPTNAEALEIPGYEVQSINQTTIKGSNTVATVKYSPIAYTITYQTGEGGSYVAPASVYTDADIPEVDVPTKLGYTFKEWNYSAGDGNTMPAQNIVAIADWEENTKASYTINYWQESLSGGYELAHADGKTDADVKYGEGTVGSEIQYETKQYAGFHLNEDKSNIPVTITADGKAVKDVFYDRNEYSIKFYKTKEVSDGWWGSHYEKGEEYVEKRITAKYGADISEEWLKSSAGIVWKTAPNETEMFTTMVNMPLGGDECYYKEVANGHKSIVYYVETLNPGEYKLFQEIEDQSFANLTDVDKQPIDGFTFSSWLKKAKDFNPQGIDDKKTGYNGSWLKYTRNSYAIHFSNCQPIDDASVKFEDQIGKYFPDSEDVKPPADIDSDSVFVGWYTAKEGGEKVDPNTPMPSHVMQLFARWEKPTYTVTYETGSEKFNPESLKLKKGEIITLPDTSQWDGFLGWYTDPDFAHEFVPDSQIGKDITLYGKWEKDNQTTYTIQYIDGAGNLLKTVVPEETVDVGSNKTVYAESQIEAGGKLYYPTDSVVTISVTQNAKDNVAVFTCNEITNWTYTVKYQDKNGKTIADEERVTTTDSVVQARAKSVAGYQLAEGQAAVKSLSVNDSSREIIFVYDSETTSYKVQHLTEQLDGSYKIENAETFDNVKVGAYVTAEPQQIEGYELETVNEKDRSAAVKANGETVIEVRYGICKHTVTYQVDEKFADLYKGSVPETQEIKTGTVSKVAGDLALDGYEFTGWISQDVSLQGGLFTMPSKDVTFVGSFRRDFDSVTVDSINKLYDGKTSSLTVSGLTADDEVAYWSEDGSKQLGNEFLNVADSGKVIVRVRNTVTGESKDLETTVTIEKRNVKLTSATDSKTYDGTPLTNGKVTVGGNGFVGEEGATYKVTGSQLLPDTSNNTFTYELKANTDENNYVIKTEEGTLTVNPVNDEDKYVAKVTANSKTVKYDGQKQEVSGLTGESFTWNEQEYTIEGLSASAEETNAGEYPVEVKGTAVVKDAAGNDVTAQFKVDTEDGKLIIEKRNVVLTSATDSKTYDGTPLTNDKVEVSGDGFVGDEGATYDVTGSQLLPDTSPNTFTYELNDNTDENNYIIETEEGTLTVSPVNDEDKYVAKVTANSKTVKYNGQKQEVSGLTGESFTWNEQEYTIEGLSASAEETNAGEYPVEVVGMAVVKDAAGNDVTAQFEVDTEDGKLIIEKRNVVLTSATDSKTYDGTPLTNDEVKVSGDGFVGDEGAAYDVTGSQLLPDTSPNTFTYQLNDNTDENNYIIETEEGTLTVNSVNDEDKYVAKVTANSKTVKYNGQKQEVSGLTGVSFTWNEQEYTIEGLSATAEATDAGEYPVVVKGTAVVKDQYGNDVTKQFKVATENGQLNIEKRTVTISTDGAEKPYDGTPLTNNKYSITAFNPETGEGFVPGEEPEVTVTGTITNVGSEPNAFNIKLSSEKDEQNYTIVENPGTLTVTKANATIDIEPSEGLTLTADGYVKKYDGIAETITASATNDKEVKIEQAGLFYTVKDLATGKTSVSAEAPTFTNSGKWEVTVSLATENAEAESVTVTVEIQKRNVLLISEDNEWKYDGSEHKHEVVNVHEERDGFVEGEEPEYHSFASITNVGETDNSFSYRFNKRGGATVLSRMARIFGIASEDPDNIEQNYNIEVQHGKLKVTKAEKENHNLSIKDKTVTYDGKEQVLDPATSDIEGAELQYSETGAEGTWSTEMPSYVDAGDYTVYVRAVHGNYEDADAQAVLHVLPAELKITTESAEKEYDGKPLTAAGHTVTGLAEGDEVEIRTTGSQTEVGESKNTYELTWTKAKEGNYTVTEELGTLKVTEAKKAEEPKKDDEKPAPKAKEEKKASKVATALGLDPALWTSIMGAAGLGLVSAARLSRKDKKKKED